MKLTPGYVSILQNFVFTIFAVKLECLLHKKKSFSFVIAKLISEKGEKIDIIGEIKIIRIGAGKRTFCANMKA
jgi:hypothetical protein